MSQQRQRHHRNHQKGRRSDHCRRSHQYAGCHGRRQMVGPTLDGQPERRDEQQRECRRSPQRRQHLGFELTRDSLSHFSRVPGSTSCRESGYGDCVTTHTATSSPPQVFRGRQMLNKVPEITVYFWIIKILCTTVGESFADYLNVDLGFGTYTLYFVGALTVVALAFQFATRRYIAPAYWVAVVLISVFVTLITDN